MSSTFSFDGFGELDETETEAFQNFLETEIFRKNVLRRLERIRPMYFKATTRLARSHRPTYSFINLNCHHEISLTYSRFVLS